MKLPENAVIIGSVSKVSIGGYMRQGPALVVITLLLSTASFAQTRVLTAEDYARAEKFMGYNTNPLVLHSGVRATWLPDDRFWYRVATENGNEFVLVDPARNTRGAAFDQTKVAAALSAAAGMTYDAFRLPFTTFTFENNDRDIAFNIGNRRWTCDVQGAKCTGVNRTADLPNSVLS